MNVYITFSLHSHHINPFHQNCVYFIFRYTVNDVIGMLEDDAENILSADVFMMPPEDDQLSA